MKFAGVLAAVLVFTDLAPNTGFADTSAARTALNLDGVWNFATDPDNRGETEKWFLPDAKVPAMPLPGYAPKANLCQENLKEWR